MRAWFSFLWMAPAELRVPVGAALIALLGLVAMAFAWRLTPWLLVLPAAVFLAAVLWGWTRCYRRLQALDDLPLSKIASAAQGYTRLDGRAAAFPGKPLMSPVGREPCCWYSYRILTYDRDGDVTSTEHETTDWSFMMSDGSGECVVDPVGARIVPVRVNRYRDAEQSWTEHVILPGDRLCVIGDFTTNVGDITEQDIEMRTGQLIAEWKKDRHWLEQRFRPAQAGSFSEAEWEAVRAQARREVQLDLARHPQLPQNRMQKPAGDEPFLISAESQEQLARDFRIWAWLHAVGFVGGVGALAVVVLRYS